jgi:hypothetical protein
VKVAQAESKQPVRITKTFVYRIRKGKRKRGRVIAITFESLKGCRNIDLKCLMLSLRQISYISCCKLNGNKNAIE